MSPRGTSRERVIMFADVVGSTGLYESLGDTRASGLIRERLQLLRHVASKHDGETVAEIGDELMCVFLSVDSAASASCEMHAVLTDAGARGTDRPLRVRIGMHLGEMTGTSEDLIGETAKIAQWAARHAKPEQTLITRKLYQGLSGLFKAVSRYVDDETWNFVSVAHLELYELIWDVEAVTAFKGETLPPPDNRYLQVRFISGDHEFVVDDNRPVMSVGRHASNDVVIPHDLVSRQHFSVQFSRGRCTVTDNSTNGTFIVVPGEDKIPVRRETFPLHGTGRIYLGEPSESKDKYAIKFSCD